MARPTPSYTYHYIGEEDLTKLFGFCQSLDVSYQIHLCAYAFDFCYIEGKVSADVPEMKEIENTMNRYNTYYPYIKYFFKKEEGGAHYTFPSFVYQCPVINTLHPDERKESSFSRGGTGPETGTASIVDELDLDDKSPEQIHFETECFQRVVSMLQDETAIHEEEISVDHMYKGYVQYGTNHLFLFYDITPFQQKIKPEYAEGIIDELLYKKKIGAVPIDTQVVDFFKKNYHLTSITTEDGYHIPFPFQLYMCSYKNNQYGNLSKSQTSTSDSASGSTGVASSSGIFSFFQAKGGAEPEKETASVPTSISNPIENSPDEMSESDSGSPTPRAPPSSDSEMDENVNVPLVPSEDSSIFSSYSFQQKGEIIDSMTEPFVTIEHEVLGPCYLFSTELINENELVDRIPVFIVNCFYMNEPLDGMTEEDKKEISKKLLKSCSVYFKENQLQLWGIRNITQIGNSLQTP